MARRNRWLTYSKWVDFPYGDVGDVNVYQNVTIIYPIEIPLKNHKIPYSPIKISLKSH